jgi:CheY-like chemotaxis protein/two-component sensor histidine kinase
VKQILTFRRQSEPERIPVYVQQVLSEVVKLARSTIPSNIEITQDIKDVPVYVEADPTQLHQIAMNLIINAYHAVAKSNGRISIHLGSTHLACTDQAEFSLKPGNYVLLSVSDNGCGIDPAIMDKIFEPYFTTRPREEGSGLGLAVVYGTVKAYGGDIKIDSEVGKGTAIQIYLPLTEKTEKASLPEPEVAHPTGNERILFVDDEEMVVHIANLMLERLGYQVTSHTDSAEALEAFRADPGAYDLVISDMTMPKMTGDRLAAELLKIRPGLPVIICTGYSERMGQGEIEAIGVRGFLKKPISISDISRKVRDILDAASSQT